MRLRSRRLLAVALLVVACADSGERPPQPGSARYDGLGRLVDVRLAPAVRPNVVLVCLDTVRADAVEPMGGASPAMPSLAAYGARSTRFVDASGPASWTMPAIASLVTGLSPERHACHGPGTSSAIVASIATLAEYLRAAGYATAAFTGGGWISNVMGFDQGFDAFTRYDAITREDAGATFDGWIATVDRRRPYFLFVHSYEAHDPYGRKRPAAGIEDPAFVGRVKAYVDDIRGRLSGVALADFAPDVDRAELLLRWRTEPLTYFGMSGVPGRATIDAIVHRYVRSGFATDPRRPEIEQKLREAYTRGLKRVDDGFAALMRSLAPVAPPDSTIVVVTSDHGEAFGEQGVIGHGRSLIDVLTRVMITIRAPGRLEAGAVRGSSTLADVVPTVLELCGMPTPEGLDGVSLLPLARGTAPGRPVEADEYDERVEDGEWYDVRVVSVRDERSKFVTTVSLRDGRTDERLFDLVADPSEVRPLPVVELARLGDAFASAVARARARVAGFATSGAPK